MAHQSVSCPTRSGQLLDHSNWHKVYLTSAHQANTARFIRNLRRGPDLLRIKHLRRLRCGIPNRHSLDNMPERDSARRRQPGHHVRHRRRLQDGHDLPDGGRRRAHAGHLLRPVDGERGNLVSGYADAWVR